MRNVIGSILIIATIILTGCTGPQLQQSPGGGIMATAGFQYRFPQSTSTTSSLGIINDDPETWNAPEDIQTKPPGFLSRTWSSITAGPKAYATRLEEKPVSTLFYSAASILAIGEATGTYGFSDLADDISGAFGSGSKDKEPVIQPNTFEARDGGTINVRDAGQGNFSAHSFRSVGKDSQINIDFQAEEVAE